MKFEKKYEVIIIIIISLLFLFILISNFFPIIEGIEITNAEKNMIYEQQANVEIIKTKQTNLMDELRNIKNELKSSNKQMNSERKKMDDLINSVKKKAEKKTKAIGI